jgi:hypothetical protein
MNKKFILLGILWLLIFVYNFSARKVLVLNFEINRDNNIKVEKMYLDEGYQTRYLPKGDYSVELIDNEGNVINKLNFKVDFVIYTDPPTLVNETWYEIALDYYKSAEKVRIKYKEKVLFESTLKVLCNNNSRCDENENVLSCPSDCNAGNADYYCTGYEDGICDPDCSYKLDKDCSPPIESPAAVRESIDFRFALVGIAVIFLIAVVVVIFFITKK